MKISMIPNKIVKLIHASKGDTSLRKWAFEPYDNNGAINVSNIKDQLVYKTENGGTEQLLPVNTSTPTTSYFDGTINYGTDTDVEFTYKQSSYTGQARIKSIKGNTLVWNQLVTDAHIHVQRSTALAWNTFASFGFSLKNGHKYLIRLLGQTVTGGQIGIRDIDEEIVYRPNTGYTMIYTATKDTNSTTIIQGIWAEGTTDAYFNIFDLTMNGFADNVDQFKSLFPLDYYAYNSGSLLNFNGTGIKTTGKNLLEVKAVNITADGVTFTVNSDGSIKMQGTSTGGSSYIVLDNATNSLAIGDPLIRKGTSIKCYTGDSVRLAYRMGSNYGNIANGGTLTATDDIYHFYIQVANGVTIDKTVYPMVTFADATDSTFEPYTSSTLSLPISTYFRTGMKSAGSVYDELSDKAITRVGSVDLGSLEWTAVATGSTPYRMSTTSIANLIKKASASSEVGNLACDKYPTGSADSTYLRQTCIAVGKNGDVLVYDPNYNASSSASAFKTAMSGVYLNYELATYTETDIQNASLVCKNIEVPCYLSNGNLVCDATEELTNESGFFDAKLKLKDSSSVAYSSKFKLHVEDL